MKKSILLRINLLAFAVLIVGFIATFMVSYYFNVGVLRKEIEDKSNLVLESVYHQIDSFFTKPVYISSAMANDVLLKKFLFEESSRLDDNSYIEEFTRYLKAYQKEYGYSSVFLVSAKSKRYYHHEKGLDRVLHQDNPENTWFYDFLSNNEAYSLNVDNDEVANNTVTVFVNYRIQNENGENLAVVGVGMRIENLEELLYSYFDKYGVKVALFDEASLLNDSANDQYHESINLFDQKFDAKDSREILASKHMNKNKINAFWNFDSQYLTAQYIPTLKWYLVTEISTEEIDEQFRQQFLLSAGITILIALAIFYAVYLLSKYYKDKIVQMTVSHELEYRRLLHEATEGLYESVFDVDLSNNAIESESAKKYFRNHEIEEGLTYDTSLEILAKTKVFPEFTESYLAMFSRENLLKAFAEGSEEFSYEVKMKQNEREHKWIRMLARLFYWKSDETIHVIMYCEDITLEKERTANLIHKAQIDQLTGLFHKKALEVQVEDILREGGDNLHALILFDIDYFKHINDTHGHPFGDVAIRVFGKRLSTQFRASDIRGRIGGDEFAIFLKNIPNVEWLTQQLELLLKHVSKDIVHEGITCPISSSMGAALSPKDGRTFKELYNNADIALYKSKENGRARFTVFEESMKD